MKYDKICYHSTDNTEMKRVNSKVPKEFIAILDNIHTYYLEIKLVTLTQEENI